MSRTHLFAGLLSGLALLPGLAGAAVSADEAAKLKTTLTPFGAERAGNKAGTIPAWDGGYTKVTPGYKPGDTRADPFPDDKSQFSISAKNADQYADKLSDGVKALLKKHPSFRLDVYPTRRTAAAPDWVYENTFKNATRAKIDADGKSLKDAYGGLPFPIPKTGVEALWNHRVAWVGESDVFQLRTFFVTADGKRVVASQGTEMQQYPYYYRNGSLESYKGYFQLASLVNSGPASKAGEALIVHSPSEAGKPYGIWQYLVGQRRVRKAPSVSYDTPDFVTSGAGFFDEAFLQLGPFDRHDYKIVGKKEMYIPYNNNRAASAKVDDLITPNHLNPSLVRWELHRVWEVEATLKTGQRHVVTKRKYYFDEDTWQVILLDGWDAEGELWRTTFTLTLLAPDAPALLGNVMWGGYDLRTGVYFMNCVSNELSPQYKLQAPVPESRFSPEELASQGGR